MLIARFSQEFSSQECKHIGRILSKRRGETSGGVCPKNFSNCGCRSTFASINESDFGAYQL